MHMAVATDLKSNLRTPFESVCNKAYICFKIYLIDYIYLKTNDHMINIT